MKKQLEACVTVGFALFLGWMLNGCASQVATPSPLAAAKTAAELGAIGNFTDMGIVMYAAQVLDAYEKGQVTNEIITLAGGGIMGGLGTGAAAAPPAAQGMLLGANSLLLLLNLWHPVDRSNIYSQGGGLIRESLGQYVQGLVGDGYCTVPTDKITPAGAVLFASTNSAIKVVNDFKQGLINLTSPSVAQIQATASQKPLTMETARQLALPNGCK